MPGPFKVDQKFDEDSFEHTIFRVYKAKNGEEAISYDSKWKTNRLFNFCGKTIRWIFYWDTYLGNVRNTFIKIHNVATRNLSSGLKEGRVELENQYTNLHHLQGVITKHNGKWWSRWCPFLFWNHVPVIPDLIFTNLEKSIELQFKTEMENLKGAAFDGFSPVQQIEKIETSLKNIRDILEDFQNWEEKKKKFRKGAEKASKGIDVSEFNEWHTFAVIIIQNHTETIKSNAQDEILNGESLKMIQALKKLQTTLKSFSSPSMALFSKPFLSLYDETFMSVCQKVEANQTLLSSVCDTISRWEVKFSQWNPATLPVLVEFQEAWDSLFFVTYLDPEKIEKLTTFQQVYKTYVEDMQTAHELAKKIEKGCAGEEFREIEQQLATISRSSISPASKKTLRGLLDGHYEKIFDALKGIPSLLSLCPLVDLDKGLKESQEILNRSEKLPPELSSGFTQQLKVAKNNIAEYQGALDLLAALSKSAKGFNTEAPNEEEKVWLKCVDSLGVSFVTKESLYIMREIAKWTFFLRCLSECPTYEAIVTVYSNYFSEVARNLNYQTFSSTVLKPIQILQSNAHAQKLSAHPSVALLAGLVEENSKKIKVLLETDANQINELALLLESLNPTFSPEGVEKKNMKENYSLNEVLEIKLPKREVFEAHRHKLEFGSVPQEFVEDVYFLQETEAAYTKVKESSTQYYVVDKWSSTQNNESMDWKISPEETIKNLLMMLETAQTHISKKINTATKIGLGMAFNEVQQHLSELERLHNRYAKAQQTVKLYIDLLSFQNNMEMESEKLKDPIIQKKITDFQVNLEEISKDPSEEEKNFREAAEKNLSPLFSKFRQTQEKLDIGATFAKDLQEIALDRRSEYSNQKSKFDTQCKALSKSYRLDKESEKELQTVYAPLLLFLRARAELWASDGNKLTPLTPEDRNALTKLSNHPNLSNDAKCPPIVKQQIALILTSDELKFHPRQESPFTLEEITEPVCLKLANNSPIYYQEGEYEEIVVKPAIAIWKDKKKGGPLPEPAFTTGNSQEIISLKINETQTMDTLEVPLPVKVPKAKKLIEDFNKLTEILPK